MKHFPSLLAASFLLVPTLVACTDQPGGDPPPEHPNDNRPRVGPAASIADASSTIRDRAISAGLGLDVEAALSLVRAISDRPAKPCESVAVDGNRRILEGHRLKGEGFNGRAEITNAGRTDAAGAVTGVDAAQDIKLHFEKFSITGDKGRWTFDGDATWLAGNVELRSSMGSEIGGIYAELLATFDRRGAAGCVPKTGSTVEVEGLPALKLGGTFKLGSNVSGNLTIDSLTVSFDGQSSCGKQTIGTKDAGKFCRAAAPRL